MTKAKAFALCCLAALLASSAAKGGSFNVPYDKPALTIAVPDAWHPNGSEDGVDASSPDRSVFFSLAAMEAESCTVARDDALGFLTRNGMTIDKGSATEATVSLAGIQAAQTQYAALEDSKARQIIVIVGPVPGKRCLQLAQWGAPDSVKRYAAAVAKIYATIKLRGK